MVHKSIYRRIFRHSVIYVAGTILSRAISFILLPIYTRYLTPSDYGVVGLISMTCDVIAMIIGVGITAAVLRFYSEKESPEEKKRVISTALIGGSAFFIIVFGLTSFFSKSFSILIFGEATYTYYMQIAFITMIFYAFIEVPLAFLRADARSVEFVIINLVKLIIQFSLNVWFIVFLGYGVLGILYSSLISFVLISIYLLASTVKECGFGFSRSIFRELLQYGYPLILADLGAFVLTFSDRYFLRAYQNLTEVGLYSLGYKLGMLLSFLLIAPFHQHWAAEMFQVDKREDRKEVFVRVFTMISITSLIFIFTLSVYIKEIIRIISAPEYLQAYTVVPFICVAYYFNGMMEYVQLGSLIRKKTKYVAYSTTIAAVSNIILNFLLIPPFGIYGAGVSTIISFYIRFIIVYKLSQKVYPLSYRWTRLNILLAYSAAILLASYQLTYSNLVASIAKDTAFLALFLALTFLFWLRGKERELILTIIKNPRKAAKVLAES
ncbi:MAG: flippase [Candidatus Zixiibacteriota bacterium]|nr:MAG: flippase [candidate division Zixibacteria bacterium]